MDQTRNPISKPKMVLRVDEDREAIIGSQDLLSSDYDPRSVARRLQQPPSQNAQVWRYMPFARFVWLLLKKQLWFSRVDLLGDKHEALLSYETSDATWNQQLRHEPIFAAWLKRPMFAYEREVRVGLYEGWFKHWPTETGQERTTIGAPIDWDPEQVVARIHVHPEADFSYAEAVNEVLRRFAPKLATPGVAWSSLGASAPY